MEASKTWVAHAMRDGTFEVAPSAAFKNSERWFSDYIAQNIKAESDARLMAAAPELLEQLKLVLPLLEGANSRCKNDTAMIQSVRAAIAKAQGGAA
jgi:hypothetical protein